MREKYIEIQRYPATKNKSLKAWSAADEHLLHALDTVATPADRIAIINDRFGFLTINHSINETATYVTYDSQEWAIRLNAKKHHCEDRLDIKYFLELDPNEYDVVLIKIPKSLHLFEFFLMEMTHVIHPNTKIICGFMTKHFTPQMIKISEQYFDHVEQSKAQKKARLIYLTSPKEVNHRILINQITYKYTDDKKYVFRQYYGVFSSKHIDYATQFLLQNLPTLSSGANVLDLACGDGVIGKMLYENNKDLSLHLLDDFHLAIQSSKLNFEGANINYHTSHSLDQMQDEYFDLIVCNPPFHFEYENTIEISLSMFGGVRRILKENGKFLCVANRHLNYYTHLQKYFSTISKIENEKFVIYKCLI